MKLCLDAGPMENEHRFRGIGSCTQNLLAAMTPALLSDHAVDLQYLKRTPLDHQPPQGGRHAPRSRLVDWVRPGGRLPSALTMRWPALAGPLRLAADVRATGAEVFLATDPSAVPDDRRFRTVAMLYDLIPLRFPAEYLPRRAVFGRANYAWQMRRLRRADHLIAISEATRRDAVELLGIDPRRISVVHLAVDDALFQPADPEHARAWVRQQFQVDRPYFLYVGGVDARKSVHRLVDAFAQVMERLDASLIVAGHAGPRGDQLRQRLEGTAVGHRIHWTGYVADDDLPLLYAGALAFAYPSLYEGFGLPVLEAMSCGAPVITSPLSSLPEVVGSAALFADPTSTPDIARALQRIAEEPSLRAELRGRGLERARRFSWQATAGGVLHACRSVLEERA